MGRTACCVFHGQGATEYLVLLAVVLVIALVGIALLGFFPGTASDAQETESRLYWQSASPIAITEWGARLDRESNGNYSVVYLRVRNRGQYPITITKILANGQTISNVWTGQWYPLAPISSAYALQPGEEKPFGGSNYAFFPGVPVIGGGNGSFFHFAGNDSYLYQATLKNAATSLCQRTSPYGYLITPNFGFEYTTTVEGQTITKQQIGRTAVIRCMPNWN